MELKGSHKPKFPSFFDTSPFTFPFQEVVNTYGIPRYKEVNAGLFALVWFPYMFGTMFGDLGHGSALLIFTLFLFLKPNFFGPNLAKVKSLLLFMGFFSAFSGLIYNDFLSISVPIFSSCWKIDKENNFLEKPDCTYFFGIDTAWNYSSN